MRVDGWRERLDVCTIVLVLGIIELFAYTSWDWGVSEWILCFLSFHMPEIFLLSI